MILSEQVRTGESFDPEVLADDIAETEERWKRAARNFGRRAAEVEWLHRRITAIAEWVSRDDIAENYGEIDRYRREVEQQLAEALKSGDAEVLADDNADVERRANMEPVDRGVGLARSKTRIMALTIERAYHAVEAIKHKEALEHLRKDIATVIRVLGDAEFNEKYAAPEQTGQMAQVIVHLLSRALSEVDRDGSPVMAQDPIGGILQ